MAVEAKRGCGFRKVGGLYLVADYAGEPCGKLPIALTVCECCGQGIKQTRGTTWLDTVSVFRLGAGLARDWLTTDCLAPNCAGCPVSHPHLMGERALLVWIGRAFYPTPADFVEEARRHGISRRIAAVPKGFKVGEHWLMLAHPHAIRQGDEWRGGIISIVKPHRLEKIVTASQAEDTEEMEQLAERGITPVVVPDDDPDHNPDAVSK